MSRDKSSGGIHCLCTKKVSDLENEAQGNGVQHSQCHLRSTTFSMLLTEYNILYVTYGVQHSQCHLRSTTFSMLLTEYNILNVTYGVQHSQCHLRSTTFSMSLTEYNIHNCDIPSNVIITLSLRVFSQDILIFKLLIFPYYLIFKMYVTMMEYKLAMTYYGYRPKT